METVNPIEFHSGRCGAVVCPPPLKSDPCFFTPLTLHSEAVVHKAHSQTRLVRQLSASPLLLTDAEAPTHRTTRCSGVAVWGSGLTAHARTDSCVPWG